MFIEQPGWAESIEYPHRLKDRSISSITPKMLLPDLAQNLELSVTMPLSAVPNQHGQLNMRHWKTVDAASDLSIYVAGNTMAQQAAFEHNAAYLLSYLLSNALPQEHAGIPEQSLCYTLMHNKCVFEDPCRRSGHQDVLPCNCSALERQITSNMCWQRSS